MKAKNFQVPFAVIILTLGFVLGLQIDKVFSDDKARVNQIKLNEVLSFTEKYYIEDVNSQELVEAAINGMLQKLDPHSVYISAKQMQSVDESFRGDFEGIGIEFQVVNDTLTVVSPITGGPSEELGIMSGDRIIRINGNPVIGISNEEVRQKLRGNKGTYVDVTISRSGTAEYLEYHIKRDKIPLYSVDTHFMLDGTTGYISVSRFSETTGKETEQALNDLKNQGMQQLILDLRGNPGGILSQAFRMADLFIDNNKKIVYTIGRRSEFNETYYAENPSPYESIPLVILVNKGSASASEIVAGAVQDWDRGLIVGETTFGKGLVQRQFLLPDNSALRLTISEYFTPSGRLIQRSYKDKQNKREYYSELGERDEGEGDNLEHLAESDSTKPTFKTNKGRTVFGGGGITPDYFIKTQDITEFTINLLKNNVFYQYVLHYLDNEGSRITAAYGNDLNKFISEFSFSEEEIKDFLEFSNSKDVEFVAEQFVSDKEYILARLKAQLARNYWKNLGWFSVLVSTDKQVQKCKGLFTEARDLANIK